MLRISANLTMLFTEHGVVERFGAASAEGFKGVEFLFPYDHDLDAIEAALRQYNLELTLFNFPVGNFAAGERGFANDPRRHVEFRQSVTKTLDVAERLGTPLLNCLVGVELGDVPPGDQRLAIVENLRYAADEAAKRLIRVCVEPLNRFDAPGFMLSTAHEAWSVIDQAGHENLWLQYDFYHEQRMAGNITATFQDLIDRIAHIQIADSPARHQPGTGEINYQYVLDTIAESSYQGWVALEFAPEPDTLSALQDMRDTGLLDID